MSTNSNVKKTNVSTWACKARTSHGGQCRNDSVQGKWFCPTHQAFANDGREVPLAPKPDVVLFKFNVGKELVRQLESLGVPVISQDKAKKEASHVEHAESVGRKADAYGAVDSGTAYFGRSAENDKPRVLRGVDISRLYYDEMPGHFKFGTIHIQCVDKPMDWPADKEWQARLVISCSNEDQFDETGAVSISAQIQRAIGPLIEMAHDVVIFANPPRGVTKKIVHTVKTGMVVPGRRAHKTVVFNDGLYEVANW